MKRNAARFRRWPLLLLIAALLWTACGAPLTSAEWLAVPARQTRSLRQVPSYARRVLLLWHTAEQTAQAAPAVRELHEVRLFDESVNAVRVLTQEEYLIGTVAAEMPASWPAAALSAQAVAARTRLCFQSARYAGNGCATHPEADACSESACCQGWLSPDARRERWGDAFAAFEKRVAAAVAATAGLVLTWQGAPIEALYHAFSGGQTEDAAAVFSASVPYLVSVSSPGEEALQGFADDASFTLTEAAARLQAAFPRSGVTASELPAQLEITATSASGRVTGMRVGSITAAGREVRAALDLRSTLFTFDCDRDHIVFHVLGYGHGVGMSQAGACAMAQDGADYAEILAHYYPGTVLAAE